MPAAKQDPCVCSVGPHQHGDGLTSGFCFRCCCCLLLAAAAAVCCSCCSCCSLSYILMPTREFAPRHTRLGFRNSVRRTMCCLLVYVPGTWSVVAFFRRNLQGSREFPGLVYCISCACLPRNHGRLPYNVPCPHLLGRRCVPCPLMCVSLRLSDLHAKTPHCVGVPAARGHSGGDGSAVRLQPG